MSEFLSENTKAILLLTAPLFASRRGRRRDETPDLLSPGEYRKLALHLHHTNHEPADLLAPNADALLDDFRQHIDRPRLQRLLSRGFLVSQAVERWQARAIWVVSRADASYPKQLTARLRDAGPAVLYGCGDKDILNTGGLAVVGSRRVDDVLIAFTQNVGRVAAQAGRTLISGGAKGIDRAAMQAASEAGGRVIGVLADSLERVALSSDHRTPLLEGQLALISPFDPSAGFNAGNAMQRNKLIYALADAALVVNADLGKGGTWAGAVEQLEKLRFVPVYVRGNGTPSAALDTLRRKGALAWPDPNDAAALETAVRSNARPPKHASVQGELFS